MLHPTENQVEIAAMKLNHVLDLKFSVLTYDELVLLDSFCYQFKGIASVVFTPAVAFTLGFKAFFMLHEKSLIDHTPKSDFSSAVKERLNVLKWKKYFAEKRPLYFIKPPISCIYSKYHFSTYTVFKTLRALSSIDLLRQKYFLRIFGTTTPVLPLTYFVISFVQTNSLVRSPNAVTITLSDVLKMILHSREGTGILKSIVLLA